MIVDFMIIGAQKCGTSTLFDILSSHPSIAGSQPKEPHFFSTSENWRENLQDYESLFQSKAHNPSEKVLHCEASTTYTFYPLRNLKIWDDIYEYNPNMKFIYLVRNPVDRIISSYMHTYERGYTNLSIEKALVEEPLLLNITRYFTQINPYIQKFGRDQVLIIDFDDLILDRTNLVKEISIFLGIDFSRFEDYQNLHSNISVGGSKNHHKFDNPIFPLKVIRKIFPSLWNSIVGNSSRKFHKKPEISAEIKEMILNMLELEIKELQVLMGKDLSHWFSLKVNSI